MHYLCLIYSDESQRGDVSKAEMETVLKLYGEFNEATKKAGVFVGGEALEPTSAATTVRVRDGKTLTTDGPFAETKEQLGGFYLLDCKDLDEALHWAAKIPTAQQGSIEVRPIMPYDL